MVNTIKNSVETSSQSITEQNEAVMQRINRMVKENRKQWIHQVLVTSMPVARRWANYRLKNGENFGDFEDEILNVDAIERRLYTSMAGTFFHHIQIHGYDSKSAVFVKQLEALRYYNRNDYVKVLAKMRKAYVRNEKNRSLEYLISKTSEFIHKVNEIGNTAYQMLLDGKEPDFETWSDKMSLQDAVFEENKQFLKQTLNHLEALRKNRVSLGSSEIRLLLYQKEGCRREKLYSKAEAWITEIYESLPCSDEREIAEQTQIYREICQFVQELVPKVGYISVNMIQFIFDRGYLSKTSRDLLLKIKATIFNLSMAVLIQYPLKKLLHQVNEDLFLDNLTDSDRYVLEVAEAYEPKLIVRVLCGSNYEKYLALKDKKA